MSNSAIVMGDANTILQLPKAALRDRESWSQLDSDILAHLVQVQMQIHQSRWNKAEVRFSEKGGKHVDSSFPEFEDFVFAAVYLRQLIAKNDSLLTDAVNRYSRFVDCPTRMVWVNYELKAFNKRVDDLAFPSTKYSCRELFDAFMYGAGLLHKFPKVDDPKRTLFLEVYDIHPRHKLFYALHMSLKVLMNYVGGVTAVIYRDLLFWMDDYSLPPPDVRWHDRMFDVKA